MTQAELKEWASKKRAGLILKHATPGTMVRYAGADYEVAHQKQFPHGVMVGIYDEPPGKHVDYINPRSLTIPLSNGPGMARRPNDGGQPESQHVPES